MKSLLAVYYQLRLKCVFKVKYLVYCCISRYKNRFILYFFYCLTYLLYTVKLFVTLLLNYVRKYGNVANIFKCLV